MGPASPEHVERGCWRRGEVFCLTKHTARLSLQPGHGLGWSLQDVGHGIWDMGCYSCPPQDARTTDPPPQAHTGPQSLCQVPEIGRTVAQHHVSCRNPPARSGGTEGSRLAPPAAALALATLAANAAPRPREPRRRIPQQTHTRKPSDLRVGKSPGTLQPYKPGKLRQIFAHQKKTLKGKSQDWPVPDKVSKD